MSFLDIALPLASRGIPVTPVMPNSKQAFLSDWPTSATTDIMQINEWNKAYPNHNGAAVATGKPDGVWFFEADAPEVFDRIVADTGHDLSELITTYRVRSRMGRGHLYFRNTPSSLAMGNISQSYVKAGDWSARVSNMYVVAAGSIHPHSHEPYVCIDASAKVLPAPEWFIEWCIRQKVEKTPAKGGDLPRDASGLIPHGYIHGWMVTQAGRLRNQGLSIDVLEAALLDLVHKNCAPPIDDDKVRQVARSFERYDEGVIADIVLNQHPDPLPEIEIPVFEPDKYPVFPKYVWAGTSIYENFVKPVCTANSRIDYFMWLPAMALMLNYLGTKLHIKGKFSSSIFKGNIFMVLIGKRGETNKSSSQNDAMEYFNYMSLLAHAGRDTKNAEGRSLVWTAGSAEGFGIEMQKTNCKNGILYYDELSQLVKKSGYESSTLTSNLLLLYESSKFSNTVKATKEAYSLDPDSYCASLLANCTPETFDDNWSRMAGTDTGLNDRFFFVLEPEALPERSMKTDISTLIGSQETRRLVDKALQQRVFEIENLNNEKLNILVTKGNRYVQRAIKWALAIAVDLGLGSIDDECIERGCDIVEYEIAVKKYLKAAEAVTHEGALQLKIRKCLEKHSGRLVVRELERKLHPERYGTTAWGQAIGGLLKVGIIRLEGTGEKGNPKYLQVLEKLEIGEEE